jgi:diguanylate cyclase (GGDEF)-like protein
MSSGLVDELHGVSLEKENQDLKEILEIALQVTAQLDIENIIKNVVLSFVSRFQLRTVTMVLPGDIDESSVRVVSYRGTKKEAVELGLPSILPVLAFLDKEEYSQIPFTFFRENYPDKTMVEKLSVLAPEVIAPLRTDKGVFGFILLPGSETGQPYGILEVQYITRIVRFAAIAIENSSLFRQATTDRMTGLYSHHFFEKTLEEEMERARRYDSKFSLVMFDIDHFKDFNDTYGHLQGDRIIREIARILIRSIRQVDFAARYGGEEFAVILPSVDIKGAFVAAERIRKKIGDFSFPGANTPLHVTISLGITEYDPKLDYSSSDIVHAADKALYLSKDSGRNRVSVALDR